jgi:hydroxymethylbilane synthase
MKRKITIGSRGSDLALWQANYVHRQLEGLGIRADIKIIKTKGDEIQNLSFDKMEGKGFFTKEIERELLDGSIDLAVHSHKDLETSTHKDLTIAAVSERENPADLLLINKNSVDDTKLWNLKNASIVGTSSARRKSQMLLFRKDVIFKDLRGNVPTRINKLLNGEYNAIIIAQAGVIRLNLDLSAFHQIELPIKHFIPAPAQGVLALQTRESDMELRHKLSALNSIKTQKNIAIERKVLNLLDGGCQLPLGVYCESLDNIMKTWVSISSSHMTVPSRYYFDNVSAEKIIDRINTKKPAASVFITRDLDENSIFKRILNSNNINLIAKSLIKLSSASMKDIHSSDWVFFSSSASVYFFKEHLNKIFDRKIGAIGQATALALQKQGIKANFIGSGDTHKIANDFSKVLGEDVALFPISNLSIKTIQKSINKKQVLEVICYNNSPIKHKVVDFDFIIFTSPSNVFSFFNNNGINNSKIIAIGDTTKKALNKCGVNNVIVSWESSELALADTIFSNL